jgi:hypothetical protein
MLGPQPRVVFSLFPFGLPLALWLLVRPFTLLLQEPLLLFCSVRPPTWPLGPRSVYSFAPAPPLRLLRRPSSALS